MIYLLHFDKPIGDQHNRRGQAQHYLGYAGDVGARLAEHEAGQGAAITAYLVEQGIGWTLARLWLGDRALERRLKNRKELPKLCPICNPEGWRSVAMNYPGCPSWMPGMRIEHPIEIEFGPAPVAVHVPMECPF